jgi:phosphoribosylaminoimidazole carboxylase
VHWYGKEDVKKNRKVLCTLLVRDASLGQNVVSLSPFVEAPALQQVGHITVCAESAVECLARVARIQGKETAISPSPQVGIIMGSDSDLPTMKAAADMLDKFKVPYELTIVSAHRTPQRMYDYAGSAPDRGIKVIIAGAGGAAHLPGMVAAMTPVPVIGVPVKTSTQSGTDSLLSIVQMPRGVPVATVAIDNSTNAGLLAVRMLGVADRALLDKMNAYLKAQEVEVLGKAEILEAKVTVPTCVRASCTSPALQCYVPDAISQRLPHDLALPIRGTTLTLLNI